MSADFQALPSFALEPTACSPELGPPFQGVRIAAPASITADQRLMLCAAARLPYGALGFADHAQHLYVLAVRADGAVRRFARPMSSGDRPPLPSGPAIVEATVRVLSYFTADLFAALDIPRDPAVWFVHALLGPYVSNGLRVEILPEGAPP